MVTDIAREDSYLRQFVHAEGPVILFYLLVPGSLKSSVFILVTSSVPATDAGVGFVATITACSMRKVTREKLCLPK